jgi:hypothetical protein
MNVVNARLSLLVVILSLGMASAFASPQQKTATLPSFDEMDKDKDGIVTLQEIMVYPDPVATAVKSCDANHDSKVTRDEYASCKAVTDQAKTLAK